jgi:hypothetical protein
MKNEGGVGVGYAVPPNSCDVLNCSICNYSDNGQPVILICFKKLKKDNGFEITLLMFMNV